MAIVRAIASGNWSNTAIWNTGALPTSADDVYSNTFTVTIDISPTVLRISNAATTGVTVGGGFTMSAGGLTLTANVIAGTTAPCLTVSVGAGSSANVIGNVTGPTASASGATALVFSGTGTLNVTGSVTGAPSTGGANHGISATSGGNLNITGSVVGSIGSSTNYGINGNAVNLTITGDITAGTSSSAVFSSNAGFALNHTGNATAFNNVAAIYSSSTSASVIVTGPFLASANGTHAIFCPNWRWSSATPVSYYQVRTAVSGAIRTLFTADSVGGNPAASDVRSGTVYGPSNELTGTCAVPGAASVLSGVPVDNTTGTATISAASIRAAVGLASANLDAQFAAIPAAPSAAAIRTEMDSNSTKLANLDATVSSRLASSNYQAPLDATGTRSAVGLASSNLDTQLSGISSGVSGLPSAAAIASAVWSAATRTLTTAIDNSATIAAAVWNSLTSSYNTNGTFGKQVLIGSTSQREVAVTGSHHVAADIHELQPAVIESSHFAAGALDGVRTSIGLASANLDTQLDAIPTAAENATANRSELAPELARVSNAATTQEVADIVEGATSG